MLARILIGVVRSYQLLLSPWTPPACRFTPTCSSYAIEAIERHGAWRGTWLAMRRVTRCHPWGSYGYDPVPRSGADGTSVSAAGDSEVGREGLGGAGAPGS